LSLEKAYATATVLIFVILLINLVATRTIRLLAPRGGKA
jgi:ABC-type phosphate transport system permease subunit